METLTKEWLLQGAEYREEIEIEDRGKKGTVTIRALTAREWMDLSNSRIRKMEKENARKVAARRGRGAEVQIDLSTLQMSTFEAKCELVSLGLVEPPLAPAEVEQMKINVIEKLNDRIRKVSGIDEEVKEEIVSFRNEPGRDEPIGGSDELPPG